jgi:Tfp pilus assembly protein PilZ
VNRRKTPRLHKDERAIISTINICGDDDIALKHYGTIVDLSPSGVQILTQSQFAVGEQLEIAIKMEGQSEACSFSGVTRWVAPSADHAGCLMGIEVVNDNHGARWRHKFH